MNEALGNDGGAQVVQTLHIIDATSWSDSIAAELRAAAFVVLRVTECDAAQRLLHRRPPDHVSVVDGAGVDAIGAAIRLGEGFGVPITIVTDARNEERFLAGFAAGAADVVSPDCTPALFIARIRSLLRRCSGPPVHTEADRRISVGDVTIDPELRQVSVRGRDVHLTPIEFSMLHALMRDAGVVYSRTDLLDSVWGSTGLALERTIDAHIWKLRRKIAAAAGDPGQIVSVPRFGYRFLRSSNPLAVQHALAG